MRSIALVLSLTFIAGGNCFAGTTGVMNGYARRDDGAPIRDARVMAWSSTYRASTQTDSNGFFAFLDLPPGLYLVLSYKQWDDRRLGRTFMRDVRVNSDQTTFLTLRGSDPFCGITNGTTIAVDQSGEQFTSLDIHELERYPENLSAAPVPLAPLTIPPSDYKCL